MPLLTERDRARRAGILCCHCIRNIAYYRTGHERAVVSGNFWKIVNGNFLDIAILEWCKLYADERGEHFWIKVVSNTDHDQFFSELLTVLGVEEAGFKEYLRKMREYRDKFVAHLDQENTITIPILDIALQSTKHLYNYLRSNNPAWFADGPKNLTGYYDECAEEANDIWTTSVLRKKWIPLK